MAEKWRILLKENASSATRKLVTKFDIANVKPGKNGKYAIIGRKMSGYVDECAKELEEIVGERNVVILDDRYLNGMKFHLDEYSFTPSKGEPIVFPAKDWSVSEAWNDMTINYSNLKTNGFITNIEDLQHIPMYRINKLWIEKMESDGYTIIDIGNPLGNKMESLFYKLEIETVNWKK